MEDGRALVVSLLHHPLIRGLVEGLPRGTIEGLSKLDEHLDSSRPHQFVSSGRTSLRSSSEAAGQSSSAVLYSPGVGRDYVDLHRSSLIFPQQQVRRVKAVLIVRIDSIAGCHQPADYVARLDRVASVSADAFH